ncbi:tetraacyldisaccharide 4'-kinase [Cellvibrio sp. pealriver]|uniref:tetraacyldisaccharide 4'-kinase n=1 Tax=Cellvibrio sp. pealriver TaxID=1622269 RepID=UPI00066FEE0D|nr:tetraacyldisaccharide 4'-kinase [Cellvibrio sp. pealriver]
MRSQSSPDKQNNPQRTWLDAWYGGSRWTLWLLPLNWLFVLLAGLRRFMILRYQQKTLPTPVIVVGNISVGGTGKTPLIIALVRWLKQNGYTPGVISRGYGGKAPVYPYLLRPDSTASEAGDEPLAIFQQTNVSVVVGADRIASGKLLEDQGCDILLSDDGLQHYRLGRDIEIAVVDGLRGLGNGWRLPVGPLREPATRLKTVDWVVVNSPSENFELKSLDRASFFYVPMSIRPVELIELQTGKAIAPSTLPKRVNAVAGIGNPQRFCNTLQDMGFDPALHSFPDHHSFASEDLVFPNSLPVIMTEKDAVKCRDFAQANWFYLSVCAELPESFWSAFSQKLERVIGHKKSRSLLK